MFSNPFKIHYKHTLMSIIRKLKVLLASRKLFRNWFSAGLKYYLSKYGLVANHIKLKCDNDKEYTLTRHLLSLYH